MNIDDYQRLYLHCGAGISGGCAGRSEKLTKWKFFKFVPPVVLLYLLTMLLCTVGAWDGALVPVGVLMALMGYMIGTGGGILTANIMRLFA